MIESSSIAPIHRDGISKTRRTEDARRFEAPMASEDYSIPSRVEVVEAAPDDAPVLANLLELYVHDFSEFLDLHPGEDGRFGYPSLPLYWSESGRHPFLIRVDGKLAGLALVKRGSEVSGSEAVWDMAEFFVLRGYRGRGVGTLAAHEVWRRLPGYWEVRVMHRNALARLFWAGAILSFAGEAIGPRRIERHGEPWDLFSFQSTVVPAADSQTEGYSR
jgi:predicted acetyltransferase